MCLRDLESEKGSTENYGKTCLADLKKKLRWKIKNRYLEYKLDRIFSDFEMQGDNYRAFRIRIGQGVRPLFDCLVQRGDWKLYEKKDFTSPRSQSRGSSSSRSRMSTAAIEKANIKVEMDQVSLELMDLGLKEDQCGLAILKLTDDCRRAGFWACQNREIRKHYVLFMLR